MSVTKVGIITYHRLLNYGSVLQSYALQKAVEKISEHSCEVLDYLCPRIKHEYDFFIKTIPGKQAKRMPFLLKVFYVPTRIIRILRFKNFLKKNIRLTRPLENNADLRTAAKDYSALIAGSDQVWNPVHTDFDKAYFLGFSDEDDKKFSYAASFGFETIPNDMRNDYYRLLSSFNKISIRERQGAKIIKELLSLDVPIVLDPTLLLDQTDWNVLRKSKVSENEFILLYTIGGNISEIVAFSEKLSEKMGMKIVWVRAFLEVKVKNCKKIYTASPKEWITLFFNASYVVTNSFHGTAFSINFNKQFYTGLKPPPVFNNSRLENILDMFNLRSRLINEQTDLSQQIDYSEVNTILKYEREKSISFLRSITL